MKFSIITINFNNLSGLKKTVSSVLSQKRSDLFEYIIIDGASTDGSVNYLKTLPPSVLWISEKDRGISDAFNKGVRRSTGSAILMLNSGDFFINDGVIETVASDWKNLNVDLLSYRVQVNMNVSIPSSDDESFIYNSCSMPHQGTFVSRRCYDEIGYYSEEFRVRMDYHFFARCIKKGYSFKYIPQDIVSYEEGGTSMKPENRKRFWTEGMSVKFQYGLKIGIKDFVKFFIYCKPCL